MQSAGQKQLFDLLHYFWNVDPPKIALKTLHWPIK